MTERAAEKLSAHREKEREARIFLCAASSQRRECGFH
jgi:hypothetical protein